MLDIVLQQKLKTMNKISSELVRLLMGQRLEVFNKGVSELEEVS